MRVWFLTHRLPYAPNRGDRIRAFYFLKYLQSRAEVSLFSLVHDAEEQAALLALRRELASVEVALVPKWMNRAQALARLPTADPLTLLLLNAPLLRRSIVQRRRQAPPDVVLAYCSSMAPYAMDRALAGVPFVLDMVDVDSEKWRALASTGPWPYRWIHRRESRVLAAFERRAMGAANATLAVNEKESAKLREMMPDARVVTVPNGIALDTFASAAPPASEPIAIFCGVLDYAPNEEAALRLTREVWPRVKSRLPGARLFLVGANPTARIKQYAAADSSITVRGTVPDVRPYLWQSAVSVAPLRVARGLQNKVLEALAAGLPVIVSDAVAEGLPQCVSSGVVLADTDEEIAAAICELLIASPASRRLKAASAQLAGLSWERQLAPLWEEISRAASEGPRERAVS
jgi:sugar transferase (PEP-CTERM/EpsH1 system associated)